MNKFLIGAACIAVIAASGFAIKYYVDKRADEERIRAAVERSSDLRSYKDCLHLVRSWDAGDQGPARRRYGSAASQGLESCRAIIDIYEFENNID